MSQTLTTILSFLLPCLMTTLGGALIFFFKKPSQTITLVSVGAAGGIMFSSSIWSLLLPAFDQSKLTWGKIFIIPVAAGFVLGGTFMIILDFVCKKAFKNNEKAQKPFNFFFAMTIHNIPEGLAVGIALGASTADAGLNNGAFLLSLGIALQNFPEGLATAIPMQNFLKNNKKSFFFAFLSGIVEPIFALVGYFLATIANSILPWLLSLAAGAMIYVIVEELLPEMQENKKSTLGTSMFLLGFLIMMLLDVCL